MKHIVIGADGFLGRHLTKSLLDDGLPVMGADIQSTHRSFYNDAPFTQIDLTSPDSLNQLPIAPDDILIHVAANQYHHTVPRKNRNNFFFDTNTEGTRNLIQAMDQAGCRNLIYFSTDMVYGKPDYLPVRTDHPKRPFGPYGESKIASEIICNEARENGFNITIFRPRLIMGPGRLGIMKKLFWLITHHLPVPMIGSGHNHYQMISVFDCVSAIRCALEKGITQKEYNLGSKNPPTVKTLLKTLIDHANSKSLLLPTYGPLVKNTLGFLGILGLELMFPEQYKIADIEYLVDISDTEKDLGWTPQYSDTDMLQTAFDYYLNESA